MSPVETEVEQATLLGETFNFDPLKFEILPSSPQLVRCAARLARARAMERRPAGGPGDGSTGGGVKHNDNNGEALDALILEYFHHEQLTDSFECLRQEMLAKAFRAEMERESAGAEAKHAESKVAAVDDEEEGGREEGLAEGTGAEGRMQDAGKRGELMLAFEERAYGRFFALWKMFALADEFSDGPSAAKQQRLRKNALTFRLELLFFADKGSDCETRCNRLQTFLRGDGAEIAAGQPELYRFFALPHIAAPEEQGDFAEIFSDDWARAVGEDLAAVKDQLELRRVAREPRLVTIFREQDNFRAMFEQELGEADGKVRELKEISAKLLSTCVKLVQDLSACEPREQAAAAAQRTTTKRAKVQLLQLKKRLELL